MKMKTLKFLLISLFALPVFVKAQNAADTEGMRPTQMAPPAQTPSSMLSQTDRAKFDLYRAEKKYARAKQAVADTEKELVRFHQLSEEPFLDYSDMTTVQPPHQMYDGQIRKTNRRLVRLLRKHREADEALKAAENALDQAQATESKPAGLQP